MTEQDFAKIPAGTWEALHKLSEKRGHSLGETIRHCTNTEVYMDQQLDKGSIILCQDARGETWKVVFTHMQSK